MPFRRSIVTFRSSTLILPAHSAAGDDPWQSLKQLPRIVGFVFVERDMTCEYGQIKAVTDQSVLTELIDRMLPSRNQI